MFFEGENEFGFEQSPGSTGSWPNPPLAAYGTEAPGDIARLTKARENWFIYLGKGGTGRGGGGV